MLGLSRAPDRRLVGRERLSGFIELQLIENRLQENKASFKDYRMPLQTSPHTARPGNASLSYVTRRAQESLLSSTSDAKGLPASLCSENALGKNPG